MPRWDFYCDRCQHTVELSFVSYDASLQARCPQCATPLHRQPSSPSFVVHGYNAKNNYAK